MKKYIYDITLNTELGEKNGMLERYTEKGYGTEHGSINILGETNPFYAFADSNGKYTLSVTLKTLMGDREFDGGIPNARVMIKNEPLRKRWITKSK